MASSSRWRIYITGSESGIAATLATFAMASSPGGADLCTGGTAVADSVWDSSYAAAKAFDGNAATRWNNGPAFSTSLPAWLEYQFPSAVAIVEYTLQAGADNKVSAPKAWELQYWSGTAWIPADRRLAQPNWTMGEVRTYTVPAIAPLYRVQATPKGSSSTPPVNVTFGTPPALGNGLIVALICWTGAAPVSCVDNRGAGVNTYSLATTRVNGATVSIFYCAKINATGAPFTITVTSAANWNQAIAIEVGGVGGGLTLDQVVTAIGTSNAPASGATAALTTAADSFQVGVFATTAAQSSIVVGTAGGAWTQEFEDLTSSFCPGEVDSRLVAGATGTTPAISWAISGSVAWATALAAFKALPPPVVSTAAVVSWVVPPATAVTFTGTRVTQLAVETFYPRLVPTRVTQVAVEVMYPRMVPTRVTQAAVEWFNATPARTRVTQEAVEVFLTIPPCIDGAFVVDDAPPGGSCRAPLLP